MLFKIAEPIRQNKRLYILYIYMYKYKEVLLLYRPGSSLKFH